MSRRHLIAATAFAAATVSAQSAFAQGYTTRIETRPFYGATVTLEEGVRVIRPLPPERHVIINPEGATPLSLGFNETKVYERRDVYNHNSYEGPAPGARAVYGGGWGGWYNGSGYGHGRGDRLPGGISGAGGGGGGHHHGKGHH